MRSGAQDGIGNNYTTREQRQSGIMEIDIIGYLGHLSGSAAAFLDVAAPNILPNKFSATCGSGDREVGNRRWLHDKPMR